MRSLVRYAAWLAPFLLAGCYHLPFHKAAPAKQHALAPRIQPSQPLELVTVELPPAQAILAGRPIYNMRIPAQPIKPPVRHRKPAPPLEAASNPDAAASPAPGVSALGVLSSGDPGNSRRQTEDSLASIERGLNGINRPLNDSEQKIAGHIREFVKQARTALASGDVEGAHTLAAKAMILLNELKK